MNKDNIIMKLDSVCQALNSVTVSGIHNMGTLAGCFTVLQEIKKEIASDESIELGEE